MAIYSKEYYRNLSAYFRIFAKSRDCTFQDGRCLKDYLLFCLVSQARLSFSSFNVGGVVIKVAVMCGGEKQGKRVWSNAIQRLVSTVPKMVHYNIHDIHDAVNRENMQVYAIWLLY